MGRKDPPFFFIKEIPIKKLKPLIFSLLILLHTSLVAQAPQIENRGLQAALTVQKMAYCL